MLKCIAQEPVYICAEPFYKIKTNPKYKTKGYKVYFCTMSACIFFAKINGTV
jgi:hypothetical protein